MTTRRHEVEPTRVLSDLRELRRQTEDDGGAQRLAFSATWATARALLRDKLNPLGVEIVVDEIGNLWATLPGASPESVVIGGHLDSVPNGGWLDGALNVFAGVEVLRRLSNCEKRPLTVRLVDWADEEGARFGGRSTLGSGVATGALDPATLAALEDVDGVTLEAAVAAFGIDIANGARAGRQLEHVGAYLELHIEQGPVLEGLGLPLAAVTGTIGVDRHLVRFIGQAAHAGATQMSTRRDALLAAARTAVQVREVALAAEGFGTCGQIRVRPGIPTAVAGCCELSIDIRHGRQAVLEEMGGQLRARVRQICDEEHVSDSWHPTFQVDATPFDPRLVAITSEVVRKHTGSEHAMASATLHDATRVSAFGIPTAMLFVQSLGGISHAREEDTRTTDLELAVTAFDEVVERAISLLTGTADSAGGE